MGGMDRPATVRVEERRSEVSGYRDATEGLRCILHVRGSTTRSVGVRMLVLTIALVASGLVTRMLPWLEVHLAYSSFLGVLVIEAFALVVSGLGWILCAPVALVHWGWRRVQWQRFEVARDRVTVTTGPFGTTSVIDGWSARALVALPRETLWTRRVLDFARWDLYAERDDGRRHFVATLYDEHAVAFITARLAHELRDASPESARHPFAVRFGPMPEGMSCEGDPNDTTAPWRIEPSARAETSRERSSCAWRSRSLR